MRRYLLSFFRMEQAGSFVMLLSACAAMIAANTPLRGWYHTQVAQLHYSIHDIGMVFFFLLIGMELKREMQEGVLRDRRQLGLPMVAALGGMLVPAAVFLLATHHTPEYWNGWAIASATDIAFAICLLMLIAPSVPLALKVFLLSIAVFDDLGAILIIACYYSDHLVLWPLLFALLVIFGLWGLAYRQITSLLPYAGLGLLLWFALSAGGVHTTLAGVITGLAIPRGRLHGAIHALHPFVSFGILPLFAFVTAGVSCSEMTWEIIANPLSSAIILGLFIGKPVGVFGASYLWVRLGLATLPPDVTWRQILLVSVLAGIGFTMSLFIGMLAFDDPAAHIAVKLGVLLGSFAAVCWAWLLRRWALRA